MAKLCVVCGSLCAYFLLILTIAPVYSINDYYFYNTASHNKATVNIDIVEGHLLQRRDIENNQSNSRSSNSTTTSVAPTPAKDATTSLPPSSFVNKTQTDNKTTKTKNGKITKTDPAPPAILNTKLLPLTHNLGVNGTGQRKISTSIKLANDSTQLLFNVTQRTNQTDDLFDEDDIDEDEDSPAFNQTLSKHNISETKVDNHIYYNSTLYNGPDVESIYWVDLTNQSDAKTDSLLSKSHRRATTVQLSFNFIFYGHIIKNVTIATGGFLYTGDYVHSWLAATQYIAPLMANFDTSLSNESYIKYWDNGTAFTVEWNKVVLQDKPNVGQFSFQTTLHENGDIVFVYRNIPMLIKEIEDDQHPVKVGLSDAYIIDRTIFLVRRKTIYEYHRINFFKETIQNGTVIYLTALSTCLSNTDCTSCLTNVIASGKCSWCPASNRCSSGVDRHRQNWLVNDCDHRQVQNYTKCAHIRPDDIFDKKNTSYNHDASEFQHQLEGYSSDSSRAYNNPNALGSTQPVSMGVSSIVAILFLIAMVSGLALWVFYAYRNPHTTSGQILIRYRPSQWSWRRGEARYTAATIHM